MLNPLMFGLGGLAVGVPILIHLLNKRRYRIVDWAAMDFLLEATEKETEAWEAVETLLKGPEINVGRYGLTVHAPGDRKRQEMRVRWWGYDAPSACPDQYCRP